MKPVSPDLIRLSLDLSRILRRAMVQGAGDVSSLRLHGLCIIAEKKTMTMSDFAHAMNVSPSTATEFADRLAASGYVKRVADPRNRRKVLLTLTRTGNGIVQKGMRKKEAVLKKLFARLSPADRVHMQRILSFLVGQ